MKKTAFLLTLLTFFTLSSCDNQRNNLSADNEELMRELAEKDSLINEVFVALGGITQNLNTIKLREGVISATIETDQQDWEKDPTAQIAEDISEIDALLRTNTEKIVQLERNIKLLKKANVEIESLKTLVKALEAQVSSQNRDIITLKAQLDEKNIRIDELLAVADSLAIQTDNLASHAATLEGEVRSHVEAINRAYYIVGARKELLDQAIVTKSGLGGRNLKVNEGRSVDSFTEVDVRSFDEVILGQKGIEIVTTHPEEAYELRVDGDEQFTKLVITDKKRFWEYSKVLVVCYK